MWKDLKQNEEIKETFKPTGTEKCRGSVEGGRGRRSGTGGYWGVSEGSSSVL